MRYQSKKQKTRKIRRYLWWIVFVVIAIIIFTTIILNRAWIYDLYRGISYQPTSEMVKIRNSLDLTSEGKFLFNASQPELSEREIFNEKCRNGGSEEIAVLGCYTENNIYVYNILDEELDGIRELTAAHELLHAVYARRSDGEKENLKSALLEVYRNYQSILKDDLNTYDESERMEELYVRAGTEVKKLPVILEKEYARVFKNQDTIVDFYEKYIRVFRKIETEMETLKSEMDEIEAEVTLKTQEYESRLEQLDADIVSFNSCAEVAGCFKSESEFYAKRNKLISEQSSLKALYQEISDLVDEYNEKVEQYNADIVYSEKLNKVINSSAKPQEIK